MQLVPPGTLPRGHKAFVASRTWLCLAPSTEAARNSERANISSNAELPVGLACEERLPPPPGPPHAFVPWPTDSGLWPGSQLDPPIRADRLATVCLRSAISCACCSSGVSGESMNTDEPSSLAGMWTILFDDFETKKMSPLFCFRISYVSELPPSSVDEAWGCCGSSPSASPLPAFAPPPVLFFFFDFFYLFFSKKEARSSFRWSATVCDSSSLISRATAY